MKLGWENHASNDLNGFKTPIFLHGFHNYGTMVRNHLTQLTSLISGNFVQQSMSTKHRSSLLMDLALIHVYFLPQRGRSTSCISCTQLLKSSMLPLHPTPPFVSSICKTSLKSPINMRGRSVWSLKVRSSSHNSCLSLLACSPWTTTTKQSNFKHLSLPTEWGQHHSLWQIDFKYTISNLILGDPKCRELGSKDYYVECC